MARSKLFSEVWLELSKVEIFWSTAFNTSHKSLFVFKIDFQPFYQPAFLRVKHKYNTQNSVLSALPPTHILKFRLKMNNCHIIVSFGFFIFCDIFSIRE